MTAGQWPATPGWPAALYFSWIVLPYCSTSTQLFPTLRKFTIKRSFHAWIAHCSTMGRHKLKDQVVSLHAVKAALRAGFKESRIRFKLAARQFDIPGGIKPCSRNSHVLQVYGLGTLVCHRNLRNRQISKTNQAACMGFLKLMSCLVTSGLFFCFKCPKFPSSMCLAVVYITCDAGPAFR